MGGEKISEMRKKCDVVVLEDHKEEEILAEGLIEAGAGAGIGRRWG